MIRTAHTSELDAGTLRAARGVIDAVFGDEVEESDWEHALGGIHALAYEGSSLVGHASVVMRRMLYEGRALRCGYVEGVAVLAEAQRRGHGGALMTALEGVIGRAYDLGALGSTEEAIALYTSHGWRVWRGELHALTPAGVVRCEEEEGWVYVLGDLDLDLDRPLTCDWRDGDVW